MSRALRLLASIAFAGLLAGGLLVLLDPGTTNAQQVSERPNIVFILADDMRLGDLKYMPKTKKLIGSKGMKFKRAFVSLGTCCPSRATIMRGQYAHNHGVRFNKKGPPEATGWEGYKYHGNEKDNVATRLRSAGYRTGFFGKYLNGYKDTTHIPPGWTHWFATFGVQYFDYKVNDNGTIRQFGSEPKDYQTDVLRKEAKQFISKGEPFFAYISPTAPHGPATPAPRHVKTYDGEQAPRLPSFNEEDISDKPPWIADNPSLTDAKIAEIDAWHERRVETLQALDGLVGGVVNRLEATGTLDNTYIFFTSDNGWQQGEHRIPRDKRRPYEESIRMPLLVRGPEVSTGVTSKLTLNTDFLPTFTDLAGTEAPEYVDGRSLRPLFKETTPSSWRSAILLEAPRPDEEMNLYGIRTARHKYIEYEGGFREIYNLKEDPHELSNYYDPTEPPAKLAARVQELKKCAGDSCRAAENGQ